MNKHLFNIVGLANNLLFGMCCFVFLAGPVKGATVFAVDFVPSPEAFVSFDTGAPETQITLNASFSPPISVHAIGFDTTATTLYAVDNVTRTLGVIDTKTGVFSPAQTVTGILSNHNIEGLSLDPTTGVFYLYSINGFGGSLPGALYTLDVSSGVATLVGRQGVAREVADIAIAMNGQMFAIDFLTQSLYSISKTTGEAALIGSLGFGSMQGPQGMDFDYSTGTLNAVLSNFDTLAGAFGTINTTTGAFTETADFDGHTMVIAIAAPVPLPASWVFMTTGALMLIGMMTFQRRFE